MKSIHKTYYKNSVKMLELADDSIDLVVTSPPYPMIEMWDGIFTNQNIDIGKALNNGDGTIAFELMHRELDKIWDEVFRVLTKGGIACINIGDATRTIDKKFSLYTNHSRILSYMQKLGFSALPAILWRKQTNAPNKFMGSGMMPPGAYVTLEHEYILILRKGNKKEFKSAVEKQNRRESSFFWEERNFWFSDVWLDLKGTTQSLFDNKTRGRSAAFPFELPYRLISMFSVKGDTILDPFLGIGTTMFAAIATGRNSVGYEIDRRFQAVNISKLDGIVDYCNKRINQRLKKHFEFVESRFNSRGKFKYANKRYLFPVVTRQELDIILNEVKDVRIIDEKTVEASYSETPQSEFCGQWDG
jgi:DNA modification methylase